MIRQWLRRVMSARMHPIAPAQLADIEEELTMVNHQRTTQPDATSLTEEKLITLMQDLQKSEPAYKTWARQTGRKAFRLQVSNLVPADTFVFFEMAFAPGEWCLILTPHLYDVAKRVLGGASEFGISDSEIANILAYHFTVKKRTTTGAVNTEGS